MTRSVVSERNSIHGGIVLQAAEALIAPIDNAAVAAPSPGEEHVAVVEREPQPDVVSHSPVAQDFSERDDSYIHVKTNAQGGVDLKLKQCEAHNHRGACDCHWYDRVQSFDWLHIIAETLFHIALHAALVCTYRQSKKAVDKKKKRKSNKQQQQQNQPETSETSSE